MARSVSICSTICQGNVRLKENNVRRKVNKITCTYLIEMCVLSSCEPEAALLGLEGQEAGQQSFGNLQVIAIESGGSLGDVTELMGKFLFQDGVQLRLITLQRIKLNIDTKKHGKCILFVMFFKITGILYNTIITIQSGISTEISCCILTITRYLHIQYKIVASIFYQDMFKAL